MTCQADMKYIKTQISVNLKHKIKVKSCLVDSYVPLWLSISIGYITLSRSVLRWFICVYTHRLAHSTENFIFGEIVQLDSPSLNTPANGVSFCI